MPEMAEDLTARVANFVYREAAALDQKNWSEWLGLYAENAEFWIPAWDDDGALTSNPATEVSLIYYGSRAGLEDRVARIRSGRSAASTPVPRTSHLVTNVRITGRDGAQVHVASNFATHSFTGRASHCFFGFYEHVLDSSAAEFLIRRKRIVLLNDIIPGVLDIYSV